MHTPTEIPHRLLRSTAKPSELVIADPHEQIGLVTRIPEGVGPVRIINFYHYHLWPEEKAYCAKCGAHRHRDGFTVELDDGMFALAGSTCGADLWGERWHAVRKTFRTELHEAGVVLDVRSILADLENVRAALEKRWRPVVDQMHAFQKRFQGQMRALFEALRRAATTPDHCLVVEGRDAVLVEGWPFFTMGHAPQEFSLALNQIDAAIAAGRGSATDLGVRTVDLGDARKRLDAVAQAARGLWHFFNQESIDLGRLVDWTSFTLRGPTDHKYTTEGHTVIDLTMQTSLSLPQEYRVIDTAPLRKLCDLILRS